MHSTLRVFYSQKKKISTQYLWLFMGIKKKISQIAGGLRQNMLQICDPSFVRLSEHFIIL